MVEVTNMNQDHAVLLAWTDIPEEEEEAFNEWYNREHVRDRVLAVPGFINGRRFVAVKGAPKYLAFYETENNAVLRSDAYVSLIANPDERSRHFIMRFRNPIRTLARLTASLGEGEGGMLGVLALAPVEGDPSRLRRALINEIMPALLRFRGGIAVRLLESIPSQEAVSTARHVRKGDRSLNWALLIEADRERTLEEAAAFLNADTLRNIGARIEMEMATFRMAYRVSR
ncbi:hypothetical protein [Pseudorhodoplanes sp.]|uniref:hypothetical protein n=1 Tax=Pseudorhodoplanes sp. TaxID=1934341 RepID=UPI002BD192BE|nr:hypothetical protein [Pseudorhodoplanes sp.]HWV55425.1 hypothetical protein [Pseudorhodoplanes sp.]